MLRVGAQQPIPHDVRLVTATSVDLDQAVRAGKFLAGLQQYLHDGRLSLPPLRERPGDILPLAEYFIGVYAQRLDLPVPAIGVETQRVLESYPWPGNIREPGKRRPLRPAGQRQGRNPAAASEFWRGNARPIAGRSAAPARPSRSAVAGAGTGPAPATGHRAGRRRRGGGKAAPGTGGELKESFGERAGKARRRRLPYVRRIGSRALDRVYIERLIKLRTRRPACFD